MPNTLQLKIKLDGSSKPPIWRQVQVPATINFQELHAIIQGVMGWYNAHLHQFTDRRRNFNIGIPSDFDMMDTQDGRKVKISRYLSSVGDKILYEYDFGDGWEHTVEVQKVMPAEKGQQYPRLLKGKGACPPEDCGGIWGYYNLVEAINEPSHESHEDMKEWMGVDHWDVNEFDQAEAEGSLKSAYASAKKFY